jgi:hypothetical protein
MRFSAFSSFLQKLAFQRFKSQLKNLSLIPVFVFSIFQLKKSTEKYEQTWPKGKRCGSPVGKATSVKRGWPGRTARRDSIERDRELGLGGARAPRLDDTRTRQREVECRRWLGSTSRRSGRRVDGAQLMTDGMAATTWLGVAGAHQARGWRDE